MKITILGKLESVSETPDGRSTQANPHSAETKLNLHLIIIPLRGSRQRRSLAGMMKSSKVSMGTSIKRQNFFKSVNLTPSRERRIKGMQRAQHLCGASCITLDFPSNKMYIS